MMINNRNEIGGRGENLFCLRITTGDIFRCYFLGDKAPVVDFLLEIADENHPYQCLFQVKSTEKENRYDKYHKSISTPVDPEKLIKLMARPLPTYVAGVDVLNEVIYIAPAFDSKIKYTTIPTKIKLAHNEKRETIKNLNLLKEDIIKYWISMDMSIIPISNVHLLECKHNYKSELS